MKRYIYYILIIVLFSNCNKSDFLNYVNFQKYILGGSGNYHNTEHTWYLDSLVINGVNYKLSTIQKQYNRTFLNNGTFIDSDGYSGKWDIINPDELSILYNNTLNGSYVTSKWKILDINSFKFSYTLSPDNNKYDYYFKISYK